jgi:Htaa.
VIRSFAVAALAAAAVLVPTAASAQAPGCDVASATLEWGVKESFRAYIDGSIANGEWTVADGATYETPTFAFPGTTGRIDPRDPNGSVGFAGSVRFTGHGGVLDTTIANPVLVVRGDGTGFLLLDVFGPTMDGGSVDVRETPFVELDLTGQDLTPVDGVITIDAAPAVLTAEGGEAFPNYAEGDAFDPVTVTMDVGDCDLTGQPIGTDTIDEDPAASSSPLLWALAGIVVGLVAATVVVILRRRRRP